MKKYAFILSMLPLFLFGTLITSAQNNILDTIYVVNWDTVDNDWILESKTINTFSESDLVLESKKYTYNQSKESWNPQEKHVYTYNGSSEIQQIIKYYWDNGLSKYLEYQNIDYNYNGGNVKEKTTSTWQSIDKTWLNYQKYEFNHDAFGNIISKVFYDEWDNNSAQWKKESIDSIKYFNSKMEEWQHFKYNNDSASCLPEQKHTFLYDNNDLTQRLSMKWDNNKWNNQWKDVFAYKNSKKNQWTVYAWDRIYNNWLRKRKFEYNYNDDQLIDWISYKWNTQANNWTKHWYTNYLYLDNNEIDEIQFFKWSFDPSVDSSRWFWDEKYDLNYRASTSELKEIVFYEDKTNNQLRYDKKVVYGYLDLDTAFSSLTPNIIDPDIKLYPNPVSESNLFIDIGKQTTITKILVFDYLGKPKILKSGKFINKTITLPVNDLNTGVYIIRLITNNGRVLSKSFVRR
jgi:hypothetical protein